MLCDSRFAHALCRRAWRRIYAFATHNGAGIGGLSELTLQGALNADVDGDLEITAADAALILQYVVGLVESLSMQG